MTKQFVLIAALFLAACAGTTETETKAAAPSKAQSEAEVDAFLAGFLKTWNGLDGAGIAQNYYRMGPSVEEQTASTSKMFADLKAQGFKETVFREKLICVVSPEKAHAPVKFERMGQDGKAMAPGLRAITFDLTKFPDGWRATRLVQGDIAKPLSCNTPLPPRP